MCSCSCHQAGGHGSRLAFNCPYRLRGHSWLGQASATKWAESSWNADYGIDGGGVIFALGESHFEKDAAFQDLVIGLELML